jgi:hypothetical protein
MNEAGRLFHRDMVHNCFQSHLEHLYNFVFIVYISASSTVCQDRSIFFKIYKRATLFLFFLIFLPILLLTSTFSFKLGSPPPLPRHRRSVDSLVP